MAIQIFTRNEIEWNQRVGFTIKNEGKNVYKIFWEKLVCDSVYCQLEGPYVGLDFF